MNWILLCCFTVIFKFSVCPIQIFATLASQKSTNIISRDSMDISCAPGFPCLTLFVIVPNVKPAHSGSSNATSLASGMLPKKASINLH